MIIDNLPEERAKTAGRSDAAPRLPPELWKAFMATIVELARIARDDYGLVPVVHPHVGGYLEFADEVDAALNDLPDDLVGLCLDTGHLAYAGVDPIALYERVAPRVRYLHFKNIDREAHRKALGTEARPVLGDPDRGVLPARGRRGRLRPAQGEPRRPRL